MSRLCFILLFVLVSCGDYTETLDVEERPLQVPISELSFKTVRDAIFSPQCVSCHQQYDSFTAVQKDIGKISASIASGRMPKNAPPLSAAERGLLDAWIAAGMPNAPGEGGSGDKPLAPTWASLSENVFFAKCTACHNPNGQAKFLDLSSRQAFFDARNEDYGGQLLLDFENPENSYLLTVIQDELEPMPPPPPFSNFGRLSQDEVQAISEWIRRGLP
jgi:mono/diheme cytochrome c family protein